MDALPLSKDSRDGNSEHHQHHGGEQSGENLDELPKCFRAIAAFRQDVNTKRVLTGDTRLALWRSLDELVDATTVLVDTLLESSHGSLQETPQDAVILKSHFDKLLVDFNTSKDKSEKLDAELCTFDDRLADEEMRLYEHLKATNIQPPASIYNHSFPLRSVPSTPPSRYDLAYVDPSVDGTDPYESIYGLGTSVGDYPTLTSKVAQDFSPSQSPSIVGQDRVDLDLAIADPLRDKGLSGLVEQNGLLPDPSYSDSSGATEYFVHDSELSVLSGTTPDPHPLLLDTRNLDRLRWYLLEFKSTKDRINKWLLSILRTSPLEVERLRNSYGNGLDSITRDEKTWAKHVLELWPHDIYHVDSEFAWQPWSAPITDSIGSLDRNLGSNNSEELNLERHNYVEPLGHQRRISSSLISYRKEYEVSTAKVNQEKRVAHSLPLSRVAEPFQWPEAMSKTSAPSSRIHLMYWGTSFSLNGTAKEKQQRLKPQTSSQTSEVDTIDQPDTEKPPAKKAMVDPGELSPTYDIQEFSHGRETPGKEFNYVSKKPFAALGPVDSGMAFPSDSEFASSEMHDEPVSVWASISADTVDCTQPPLDSTVV